MSDAERLFESLARAIIDADETAAVQLSETILAKGFDSAKAIERGISVGMEKVGDFFEKSEYFIPDLLDCAAVAERATAILRKGLAKEPVSRGKIVMGTIFGDTHDIGKNIVALFMEAAGYKVLDLGKDVSARRFIDAAVQWKADVLAISTLMTTTRGNIQNVIEQLRLDGKRESFLILIGGRAVTREFAQTIGADGYAENAAETIRLLDKF
ncbi:MAG: cobalamin-dependent protein [Clostridiales bacterium]|jgi:methylmalonyl-CoA mutase cobalamin-binding domain/chain|nr:cobalamin-dependent protein [Clostridiales bacterium]